MQGACKVHFKDFVWCKSFAVYEWNLLDLDYCQVQEDKTLYPLHAGGVLGGPVWYNVDGTCCLERVQKIVIIHVSILERALQFLMGWDRRNRYIWWQQQQHSRWQRNFLEQQQHFWGRQHRVFINILIIITIIIIYRQGKKIIILYFGKKILVTT